MSGPFKLKGHTLPGPNQVSPVKTPGEHKHDKDGKDELSVVISEDGSKMTRTKGNKSASFRKNPDYDPKKGDTATEEWLEN